MNIWKTCPWEEIKGFRNLYEFKRFEMWMTELIKDGVAEQAPILKRRPFLQQKWYRHKASSQIWCLIIPEPPNIGAFFKIK